MKKIVFTILLLIGFTATGFAQSDKIKEKATASIEKLNTELASIDKSLALTDDQRSKMNDIHISRLQELKKIRKAESDKEKRKELSKPVNKKHYKIIYSEVLTKEQRTARSKERKKKQ